VWSNRGRQTDHGWIVSDCSPSSSTSDLNSQSQYMWGLHSSHLWQYWILKCFICITELGYKTLGQLLLLVDHRLLRFPAVSFYVYQIVTQWISIEKIILEHYYIFESRLLMAYSSIKLKGLGHGRNSYTLSKVIEWTERKLNWGQCKILKLEKYSSPI
jgi:hypothetical protein